MTGNRIPPPGLLELGIAFHCTDGSGLESRSTVLMAQTCNPVPLSRLPRSGILFHHPDRLNRESHSTILIDWIGNLIPPSRPPESGISFHTSASPNLESNSRNVESEMGNRFPQCRGESRNRIPVCTRNPVPTQQTARTAGAQLQQLQIIADQAIWGAECSQVGSPEQPY